MRANAAIYLPQHEENTACTAVKLRVARHSRTASCH